MAFGNYAVSDSLIYNNAFSNPFGFDTYSYGNYNFNNYKNLFEQYYNLSKNGYNYYSKPFSALNTQYYNNFDYRNQQLFGNYPLNQNYSSQFKINDDLKIPENLTPEQRQEYIQQSGGGIKQPEQQSQSSTALKVGGATVVVAGLAIACDYIFAKGKHVNKLTKFFRKAEGAGAKTKLPETPVKKTTVQPETPKGTPKGTDTQVPKTPASNGLNNSRQVFQQTLDTYTNIIKNNKVELQKLCAKYQQGILNEEQFANEYAKFLSDKLNMPYYPELKQIISDTIAGGMQNTTGTLYYNLSGMNRISDLMQTINHEMHHFLQQKEIFSIMSIEQFSKLRAKADIMSLLKENPNKYKTQEEIIKTIDEQTKGYIKDFKDAGWDKILEKYPKNTNPNSPYYKHAKELLDADLNYVNGTQDVSTYMRNLLEKEAYEVSVNTQLEIEHSILNTITKEEKDVALEIYNCLNSSTFENLNEIPKFIKEYNISPYKLIETVKKAESMGLNDPHKIIQNILFAN